MDIQTINSEYDSSYLAFERFKNSLLSQVEKLLELNNIPLGFPIQNRTKNWESIKNKLDTGRYNVKETITELQDIIGLRIILMFSRDVENVCKLIEDNLHVKRRYNTSERLKENEFGYSSEHFVVKIPQEWLNVPTFKGFDNFQAEIQIRTLSQHTWAEASKELQYKNEANIPRPLLRSIGRVSALLETVDLEFERLLTERDNYKEVVTKDLITYTDQLLNVDILEAILDQKIPLAFKKSSENYSDLVEDLKKFKIFYGSELETLFKEYLTKAIDYDKKLTDKPYFFSRAGLVRVMLKIRHPEEWKKFSVNKFKNK